MSQILEVDLLYYHDIIVGYVGRDLKTKKINYYTYINEFNEITPKLRKINSKTCSALVKQIVKNYQEEKILSKRKIPKEIMWYIKEYLEKIKRFNINHSLPITNLENNLSYLSLVSILPSKVANEGVYIIPTNEIEIYITKEIWNSYSKFEKKSIKQTILHELIHMEASYYPIHIEGNSLIIKCGFAKCKFNLESIKISEQDMFYKIENCESNEKEQILEEIINEYKCSLIMPNYIMSYPNFGKTINELCNNKLLTARYNAGIDIYYDSLISIIPNSDMSNDLLGHLISCHNAMITGNKTEILREKEKVNSLIKTYKDADKKINDR